MDDIESKTCLKFVERDSQSLKQSGVDYLEFNRGTECSSQVGRQATGKQKVILGDDCYTSRTITHEVKN